MPLFMPAIDRRRTDDAGSAPPRTVAVRPRGVAPVVAALAATLCLGSATGVTAVQLDLITVDDAGAPADAATGRGMVAAEYRLQTTEVTNSQYAAFLNAAAADDPNGLYSAGMAGSFGGITRSGSPGSYSYATQSGRGSHPVNFVSWVDAARFTNWLHNGQPTGAGVGPLLDQGAYDLTNPAGLAAVGRSAGARFFLPTTDEWYKAAYRQPAAAGGDADDFWAYPTGSNTAPFSDNPASLNTPDDANVANYFRDDGVNNGYDGGFAVSGSVLAPTGSPQALSDAGAYTQASNYYGVFDQAGGVWEWGETLLGPGSARAHFGGSWDSTAFALASTSQFFGDAPETESATIGFRVAAVAPIPGDYNFDGVVDAADYTVWRQDLNSTTDLSADGNNSGQVDPLDYFVWSAAYGEATGSPAATAVPEPAGVLLLGFGCVVSSMGSRRQSRVA